MQQEKLITKIASQIFFIDIDDDKQESLYH